MVLTVMFQVMFPLCRNVAVLKDSHHKVEESRRVTYYLSGNTLQLRTGDKLLSKFNEKLSAEHMYMTHRCRFVR
jgi:hypothetical protein